MKHNYFYIKLFDKYEYLYKEKIVKTFAHNE